MFQLQTLINAVAAIGEPNWNAITQLFLTHATKLMLIHRIQVKLITLLLVNTSMKNYVDSQDLAYNTSNNNYIVSNNQS